MSKKRIVSDNGGFIVKLDYEFWQKIAEHVQTKYQKHSVELAMEKSTELFKDMNEAYEHICYHTDAIRRIKVVAKGKDDILNLTIKNYRDITNVYTVELYAECSSFEMENDVRLNIMEMMEKHKVHFGGIKVAAAVYIILIMKHMSEIFVQSDRVAYPVMTSLLITLTTAAVVFFGIVPLLQRVIYGKSKILFLVNYENKEKFTKMKKAENIITWVLFVVAAVMTALCMIL